MNLGLTIPWVECPTRILRNTGYQDKPKPVKKKGIPSGNIAIYKLAKQNGIRPQNLRSQAIKFFKRSDFPKGLTPKMAEKLINYYKERGYK